MGALTKALFLTVVLCLINLTPAKPWLNEVEVAEREENQALIAKDEEFNINKILGIMRGASHILWGGAHILNGVMRIKKTIGKKEFNLMKREIDALAEKVEVLQRDA